MKPLFLILTLVVTHFSYSQVTDQDIINATIGRPYPSAIKALDSLGIWYAFHVDNDQGKAARGVIDKKKMYSISDGKGSVKVWAYILDTSGIVNEIVINYRHDSRQQVEDARKLKAFADFHVGLYSTDYVFKNKK